MRHMLKRGTTLGAVAVLCVVAFAWIEARQGTADRPIVTIDPDDIGGVVVSAKGREAGVWVIAETTNLSTKFRKIVVTDEIGRYLVPDLPAASYKVWVRGYGLVDSPPVEGTPGKPLALTAIIAPDARTAAQIYPANYWYSLLQVPAKSEFPGTGPQGNGISPTMKSQQQWINETKQGCQLCHQMGNKITREIGHLGTFPSSVAAWDRRVQSGQRGATMSAMLARFGRQRALSMYANWTDRIAAGEVPPAPPRPQGLERNLVLSMWEWANPKGYVHDEVATDKRNPTVNANGPVYGVVYGDDALAIMDPATHATSMVSVPTRDKNVSAEFAQTMPAASPFWGEDILWTNPASVHNPMMDHKGRVWMTSRIREDEVQPDYCKDGSMNPYAKEYPLGESGRQFSFYDPTTKKVTLVETCFTTHHLQFGYDRDNTLFVDAGAAGIGWLNTRVFDETGDAERAQGWCTTIVDTSGDGRIGAYITAGQPADPTKDTLMAGGGYGLIPSPADGSIWYTRPGVPGAILRLDRGSSPPATCITEIYEPPYNNAKAPGKMGYSPRGIDVDLNGVVWTALSGSSHLASFDRRKCAVTNGPTATGQHCPEGWALYPVPGPQMKGVTDEGSADFHYYNWVDQHDTFGLGKNVPIANGSTSDSLLALQDGKWVILRVPYPLGFYTRGLDGRIDNPGAGWKGKGLWADYGTNAAWHIEGGKGTRSNVVKFQLRPNPLAK